MPLTDPFGGEELGSKTWALVSTGMPGPLSRISNIDPVAVTIGAYLELPFSFHGVHRIVD